MPIDVTLDTDGEEIVLYFDIGADGVDAKTFGNALISFDDLYRAISAVVNPGVGIEIEFIRSDTGSIKAVLKSLKQDVGGLVEHPVTLIVLPFLLSVLCNWLTSESITIIVNDNNYVVQHGNEKIVLPRDAAAKAKKVEDSQVVRQSTRNFFATLESDPNIKAVDFRPAAKPDTPVVPITRSQFPVLRGLPDAITSELPKQRQQPFHRESLVVLKAILEKTKGKWQFLWNGQRISADISDELFFQKLANHDYEFGQGDVLVVDLLVEQELNETVGAYENKRFHVTKVHFHSKGPKQQSLL